MLDRKPEPEKTFSSIKFNLASFAYDNIRYDSLSGAIIRLAEFESSQDQAHAELAHKMNCAWADKQKLTFNDKGREKLNKTRFAFMMKEVIGKRDVSDLALFADIVTAFVTLDDVIEKYSAGGEYAYLVIGKVVDALLKIFSGESQDVEANPNITEFPLYKIFCQVFHDLRARILAKPCTMKYLVDALDVCFKAILRNIRAFSDGKIPSENEFLENRKFTVGISIVFELCCILKNIQISEDLRKNPLFLSCNDKAMRILAVLNDILSLPKELLEGNKENYLLIKLKKSPNVNQVFREAQDYVNNEIQALIGMSSAMMGNEIFKKYFTEIVLPTLNNCITWHIESDRYKLLPQQSLLIKHSLHAQKAIVSSDNAAAAVVSNKPVL